MPPSQKVCAIKEDSYVHAVVYIIHVVVYIVHDVVYIVHDVNRTFLQGEDSYFP